MKIKPSCQCQVSSVAVLLSFQCKQTFNSQDSLDFLEVLAKDVRPVGHLPCTPRPPLHVFLMLKTSLSVQFRLPERHQKSQSPCLSLLRTSVGHQSCLRTSSGFVLCVFPVMWIARPPVRSGLPLTHSPSLSISYHQSDDLLPLLVLTHALPTPSLLHSLPPHTRQGLLQPRLAHQLQPRMTLNS